MEFKDTLRRLLQDDGRTQEQIEDAAHMASGLMTRYLNGDRNPGRATLKKLATTFGVSVEELEGTADQGERVMRVPGLRPTLQQLPGYADAEIAAARQEPDIDIAILRQVREISFAAPPLVTSDLIVGLARLLSEKSHAVEETDEIRQRMAGRRSKTLQNSHTKK